PTNFIIDINVHLFPLSFFKAFEIIDKQTLSHTGGTMVQEIEIEYKTLLTKNEYNILLNALPFSSETIMQTNHYFETDDFKIERHHSALRIRNKGQRYTLTLK